MAGSWVRGLFKTESIERVRGIRPLVTFDVISILLVIHKQIQGYMEGEFGNLHFQFLPQLRVCPIGGWGSGVSWKVPILSNQLKLLRVQMTGLDNMSSNPLTCPVNTQYRLDFVCWPLFRNPETADLQITVSQRTMSNLNWPMSGKIVKIVRHYNVCLKEFLPSNQ